MSWHLVEGIALPDAVSGHPALDFCNTRAGWGTPMPKEYLSSWRALVLWVREAGLIGPDDAGRLLAVPPARSEPELGRAIELRAALYAAALGAGAASDWGLVSRAIAGARSRSDLVARPDGPAFWHPSAMEPRTPVDVIASAAEALLTSPLAKAVSACPGAGCGWLFADPRHRRRWCSMAVCGNRAKARRFSARGRLAREPGRSGPVDAG